MQSETIRTKFDPKSLPRWAQNDPAVVALCKQSLSFRCDVASAGTAQLKRQLKREAANFEDRGDGVLEYVGNTTEDSGYADR